MDPLVDGQPCPICGPSHNAARHRLLVWAMLGSGNIMPNAEQPAEEAAHIMQSDDTADCPHEEAVKWNPFNRVVQCHRCGQVFVPASYQVIRLT